MSERLDHDETDVDETRTVGSNEPLVSVDGLEKHYYENDSLFDRLLGRDPTAVRAVDGVEFAVERGETLGLVGESGCGKSTTGETLLGLREATAGTVRFDGEPVAELSGDEEKAFRRRAGIVFQDPFSSLDPRQTVGEIVAEPLRVHGLPKPAADVGVAVVDAGRDVAASESPDVEEKIDTDAVTIEGGDLVASEAAAFVVRVDRTGEEPTVRIEERADVNASVREDDVTVSDTGVTVAVGTDRSRLRRERVADLLERVGLSAAQRERYPHEFSGGQRQRVGIARALALDPEFVVLDEPVSALDVSVQAQILNLLGDLQDEFDLTYLFIAHDLSVVRHISDRVAVMYLGEIVEIGPVEPIFEHPSHPYTEALLESVPRANTAERDRDVEALAGDVPSPRDPPSGCRFHTRCPHAREACREDDPDRFDAGSNHEAACFRAIDDHPYWQSTPLEPPEERAQATDADLEEEGEWAADESSA
ncbi:oligopeptide/dipeptide ABC transporter ATP-binding protein [Halococcus sp. PRR34]|uniref:ABC transporter ATP-binding protein n=1 Tax=Halococcus sp. PRR34 TaxID=3020830 RepID=UPI0023623C90|nr:oligopeptide/dipeptide ABC transporter ATP-binding protein [Halococcus sp. PRR34]